MKAIRKNSKVRKSTRKPEERFVQGLQVRGEVVEGSDLDDEDGALPSGATHVKTKARSVKRQRFALA